MSRPTGCDHRQYPALSAGGGGTDTVQGALTRYRIIAWIVGVVLIALVVVGMPLKYLADDATVVETIGPAHGFLYMVYLVATFDLGRRAHWPLGRMVLVMLAGTVPFLSFYAERVVTRRVHERTAAVVAAS
jgi:integral membrane protein